MAKVEPNFMGKDSFFWWIGVVEDRRDPKKLGRLRIRVLGAHTEDKTLIPTCELHWAYPYQPLTWNQAMNGLGHTPTGPAEGTWVFGFFKDNQSGQDPIIMGTIAGIPEEAPQPCIGFYDPGKPFHEVDVAPRKIRIRYYPNDGTGAQNTNESTASLYPRQTHPWGCILGENDLNRLARAEQVDDTIQGVRKRQRDVGRPGPEFGGIPIAFVHPKPTRKWVEPYPGSHMSDGESRYPYNHVFESESGHIVEIDDTPHKERIFIYHRSGTYIELGCGQEDDVGLHGNFAMKVVGKRFEVTMENSYSHFQNTMNVTIDGECNIYCRKDVNLQVDGNMNVHVQGDYTEKVHGNYYTDIDGNRAVRIGGNDSLDIQGNRAVKIGEGDYVSVGEGRSVAVGGSLTESSGGHFSMTSGDEISGDAPAVHWNSGHSGEATTSEPAAPVVPPFPAPINLVESRNESGSDPVKETKPDPTPQECGQKDC
jgi:Gp5 N-terminal OB domain